MIEPAVSHEHTGPITGRTLRQFAGLWIVFVGGIASWQWVVRGNETTAIVLAILATAVGVLGLVKPVAIRPLFTGLMLVTYPIGWVVSHALLAVFFFGIFTPIAAFFRLIGRDALLLRPNRDRNTYWMRKPTPSDVRSYLRQS